MIRRLVDNKANEKLLQSSYLAKLRLILGTSLLLLVQGSACQAYYWGLGGYAYNNIGSSLLWPVNSLLYPYTNYSSPYGLAYVFGYHSINKATNNNNASSSQTIPYYVLPATTGGALNSSVPAYNPGNFSNNNSFSSYNTPQNPVPVWSQNSQQSALNQPFSDPNDIFNSNYPTHTNDPGLVSSAQVPSNGQAQSNAQPQAQSNLPMQSNAQAQPNSPSSPAAPSPHSSYGWQAPNSPTAHNASLDGFIQSVTGHYKGDLVHALHQPDMRSWAESIGLVDAGQNLPNNLSKNRKNEISTVMKDNSLDANKKLYILHLLIQ